MSCMMKVINWSAHIDTHYTSLIKAIKSRTYESLYKAKQKVQALVGTLKITCFYNQRIVKNL